MGNPYFKSALFWDRVQKKGGSERVLREKKINRVARSGAGWDPIALLAKGHIGITIYWNVHSRLNLESGTSFRAIHKVGKLRVPERERGAARNGCHAS